jgi:hypothetical protein
MNNKNISKYIIAAFSYNKKIINKIPQLIVSTYFCNELYLSNSSIIYRLKAFNCRKLILVYITSENKKTNAVNLTRGENLDFVIYEVSKDNLFNDMIFTKYILKNDPLLKSMIFIFENLSWAEIVLLFRLNNLNISGGSNTLRHILSPVQLRLAQFITCIEGMNSSKIVESFHLSKNKSKQVGINLSSKEINNIINEHIDNNIPSEIGGANEGEENKTSSFKINKNSPFNSNHPQKREYNTSILDAPQRSKNNLLLTYLDSIEKLINNSSLSKEEVQKEIEDNWLNLIKSKLNNPEYLSQRYSHSLISNINEVNKTLNIHFDKKELHRKFKSLAEELNNIDHLIMTFALINGYFNRIKYTALTQIVGDAILFTIYLNRRKIWMTSITSGPNIIPTFMTYQEFKTSIKYDQREITILGDYFISLWTLYPHNIFEREFRQENYISPIKSEGSILKINDKFLNDIKENIIINPSSLPMVCPPLLWSDTSFGGYLNNEFRRENIVRGSLKHKHKTENKDQLYKAINTINSIKFGINVSLLEFLHTEKGQQLLSIESSEDFLKREITLKIAQAFKNIPFYISTQADWRGRIYAQSYFITYQGSDLSSGLLNFWEGESLTEDGKSYLYIYGANNHNEKNISKESFEKRIQWVLDNYDDIINLNMDLISKAENKFVFAAFCLNMKELHNNPNAIIKTPVFLDATCSGIQHLAALMKDIELGYHVNLVPKSKSKAKENILIDKPEDFYKELVEPINEAINKYGEENHEFFNLSLVKFDRKILKQSIMTKVYNVTNYGISDQIKSNLTKSGATKAYKNNINITNNIEKGIVTNLKPFIKGFYIAPGKDGKTIVLTRNDIFQIAKIINNQIFILFPSLNGIYSYFINISKLLIRLNIPLIWITPAGMKITQHYLKSKQNIVAIKFAGKTKKIVLREWTDLLHKNKQTQAIIPNIIHSLDANHLINLINNASLIGLGPIISIHDCFGTLPNKMSNLEYFVKKEFILLYSNADFLNTFHNRILQSISDNNFIIVDLDSGNKAIEYENTLLKIPNIPKSGNLNLNEILSSKYMIS